MSQSGDQICNLVMEKVATTRVSGSKNALSNRSAPQVSCWSRHWRCSGRGASAFDVAGEEFNLRWSTLECERCNPSNQATSQDMVMPSGLGIGQQKCQPPVENKEDSENPLPSCAIAVARDGIDTQWL